MRLAPERVVEQVAANALRRQTVFKRTMCRIYRGEGKSVGWKETLFGHLVAGLGEKGRPSPAPSNCELKQKRPTLPATDHPQKHPAPTSTRFRLTRASLAVARAH